MGLGTKWLNTEGAGTVNNTSVCKYWKIPSYSPNIDTGTFYGVSTDSDTDAQCPKEC